MEEADEGELLVLRRSLSDQKGSNWDNNRRTSSTLVAPSTTMYALPLWMVVVVLTQPLLRW